MTTDARGCQKEIAQMVVEGGGDYSVAVKGNQPTLHTELQAAFAQAPVSKLRSSRRATTFEGFDAQKCNILPRCEINVLVKPATERPYVD